MRYSVRTLVLIIVPFSFFLSEAAVRAGGGPSDIKIRVDSILARYATAPSAAATRRIETRMDPKLTREGLADRLRMMFNYNNYTLLRHHEELSPCGEAVAFNLPGGHILHVDPMEVDSGVLMLDVAMFEGARMIMRLPFRTIGGGVLMLVDEHRPNQFYITAITVDSPQLEQARAIREKQMPIAPLQPYPVLVPAE
jgi:hypothetical protein